MPRIPLADIPNAPQGANAPLTQYPDFRVNYSGIADSLKQKGLSAEPFLADAGGLGAIGRAVEQVGGIANQFAMQKLEAQNVIDVAKAENLMSDYSAKKQAEMETLPPDQWDSHFSEGLPELQKQIDDLGVSPRAAEAISANYTRWAGKTRANIGFDAVKTSIENGRQEVKVAMDRAFKTGDMEQYVRLGENAVKTGLMLNSEVEHGKFELEQAQKNESLQTAVLNNPFELQNEMDAAIKSGTGETESFGKLRAPELKKWLYAARSEARNQQIETRQDISNGIYSGSITDEAQIREMANPTKPDGTKINILPEKEVNALTKLLTREVQFNPEIATKLKTDVMGYDADQDKDMSKFHEIDSAIENTLPKAEASALKSALFQTWQHTIRDGKPKDKQQAFEADLLKQFDTLGDQGMLGKTGVDPKTKKIIDEQAHMQTWSNVETKKEQMRQWLKDNRDATPEQARQQFMDIVGSDAAQNAAKAFDSVIQNAARTNVNVSNALSINYGAPVQNSSQKINDELVNFVKNAEGFKGNAYPDFKQHSIGYGTKALSPNEKITPQEAEARLRNELEIHADAIDKASSVYSLTPSQRNSLISFDFNTGKGAFLLETSGGDINKVRERMKLYRNVTQGNKLVANQGLINRGAMEDKLFTQ